MERCVTHARFLSDAKPLLRSPRWEAIRKRPRRSEFARKPTRTNPPPRRIRRAPALRAQRRSEVRFRCESRPFGLRTGIASVSSRRHAGVRRPSRVLRVRTARSRRCQRYRLIETNLVLRRSDCLRLHRGRFSRRDFGRPCASPSLPSRGTSAYQAVCTLVRIAIRDADMVSYDSVPQGTRTIPRTLLSGRAVTRTIPRTLFSPGPPNAERPEGRNVLAARSCLMCSVSRARRERRFEGTRKRGRLRPRERRHRPLPPSPAVPRDLSVASVRLYPPRASSGPRSAGAPLLATLPLRRPRFVGFASASRFGSGSRLRFRFAFFASPGP